MADTMIYRRLADGETARDMHATDEGNFEYRIIDLTGPDDPIPEGWSRGPDGAPAPKAKAKKPAKPEGDGE